MIEKKYSTLLKESGVRDINELEAYQKADVENPDAMLGTDYDVNQRISLLGVMFQRASSQLEILEWVKYGGTRDEKKLLEYILANSKCLKRAGISMRYSKDCNDKNKKKLRK
ncbi:hypothetical protein F2Q69_00038805 [Brassica cretica]|uniref:FBD domain-containing protein n=1 Tax=Brassica cretica TaxID=69181 RepID=A0A8S9SJU6_BRACR|nr:hypothetical protein F2Q69_00038805 [Brassica cretica]